ncbi:MAG: AmmeMemoRadiSam system protein A [Candidatus Muiribacteriota bacterium]
MDFKLKKENCSKLKEIARESIKNYIKNKKPLAVETDDEELKQKRAVFVTLNKNEMLRGCIGTVIPQTSIIEGVSELAVSAAMNDPRFPPVLESELPDINIEISVLSPMKKIKNFDEIIPGKHGVMIKKDFATGLFLPQVWEHFNNDKEAFMGELCSQKAGLPSDAWKNPENIEIYVFTVFKF